MTAKTTSLPLAVIVAIFAAMAGQDARAALVLGAGQYGHGTDLASVAGSGSDLGDFERTSTDPFSAAATAGFAQADLLEELADGLAGGSGALPILPFSDPQERREQQIDYAYLLGTGTTCGSPTTVTAAGGAGAAGAAVLCAFARVPDITAISSLPSEANLPLPPEPCFTRLRPPQSLVWAWSVFW